jgi:hypothetical protein
VSLNATNIGSEAFRGCTGLQGIVLTANAYIGSRAFASCTALTRFDAPALLSFTASDMFEGTTNLSFINVPALTSMNSLKFSGFMDLEAIEMSALQVIPKLGFEECVNLYSASFPAATVVSQYAFMGCTRLSNLSLPNAVEIGPEIFCGGNWSDGYRNTALSVLSLPKASYIHAGAFMGCIALRSLYLLSTAVCNIESYPGNIFSRTSFYANGALGTVYVPSSLVTAYKTHSLWSFMSNHIEGV